MMRNILYAHFIEFIFSNYEHVLEYLRIIFDVLYVHNLLNIEANENNNEIFEKMKRSNSISYEQFHFSTKSWGSTTFDLTCFISFIVSF